MAEKNDLQRIDSFQYPAAHLGHLSQSQDGALETFKKLLVGGRYYKPADPSRNIPASHDDESLLRYLRARKFIPEDAKKQFDETERWREENKINDLYDTIDVNDYDETRRLYPQWTGRRDKRGIPLYVFQVSDLNSKKMSEYEHSIAKAKSPGKTPVKLLRLFALYENLTRFALPLCSGVPGRPFPETPVSQSNNIVDISGVGLKQFWNLKSHMQDASELATAHYPETLDRIFIIGAPSFFPTVWGWVKRWFDPITVSKIFILSSSDMKSTLEKYIDPENIPSKYGGRLDWQWGQLPSIEPAIDKALTWKNPSKGHGGRPGFPAGPVRWIVDQDGGMQAVAVGSVNGKNRREVIATLAGPKAGLEIPSTPLAFEQRHQTTGYHTHPAANQENFPSSGQTPPDEKDDPIRRASRASNTVPIYSQQPDPGHSSVRDGTSNTRYQQQEGTHAAGQLAHSTPDVRDHGYGDKTSTVEPRTVGQAHKNVDVPYAQSQTSQADNTYLGQAKSMANAAYETTTSAVGAASSTVMSAVGYGQEDHHAQPPHQQQQRQSIPQDPRVDRLPQQNVEEFIRSQYTTHNDYGSAGKK